MILRPASSYWRCATALTRASRNASTGYAVTSYAAQGKTVDYVLFSDSAVKAATNEQQWYVTISRGRKGVKIFTADKGQLRENISRGGARTLALDMKPSAIQKLATAWGRDVAFVLNVQASQRASVKRAAEMAQREKLEREAEAQRQAEAAKQSQSMKPTESVKPAEKPTETVKPPVQKPETMRRRMEIPPQQTNQKSKGMRV
jgi:hypothetical protein